MKISIGKYILVIAAAFIALALHQSVFANYLLIIGNANSGLVELYNLNGDGILTRRSTFNIWNDCEHFGDPRCVAVSRNGKYAFFVEFNTINGVLYSIDKDYGFHFIKEFRNSVDAAGFSYDEKYLVTSSDTRDEANGPKMNVYRIENTEPSLVFSEQMPTTATMVEQITTNSYNEIIGRSGDGVIIPHPPASLVIYQFDESNEKLILKKYDKDVHWKYNGSKIPDGSFIGWQRTDEFKWDQYIWEISRFDRESSGSYTTTPLTRDALDMRFTSDGKYMVGKKGSTDAGTTEGIAAYYLSPGANAVMTSFIAPRKQIDHVNMALTPDGRFFVCLYDETSYTKHLGVFRLNKQTGELTQTCTINRANWVAAMEFLPQAFPPAAVNDACALYDDTRSGKSAAAPTAPVPNSSGKSALNNKDIPEWKHVKVEFR